MTKRLDHPHLYLPIKGAPKNTIPYILSKGFELCGVSDIMFLSLNNSFYTDNNIATADTFYRGKDGTGKLVLNDPFLKLTNHKMILNSLNTLDISESQYQSLSGTNVKKVSKNRIQGRDGINKSPYKKEDVIKIPEWQFLAQSQKLLENYVNSVYSSFYTLFASHFEEERNLTNGMCFHLSATNGKTTMRPMQLRNLTGLERSAIKGTMLNNKDVIYVGKKINNKIKAPNITSRDLITLSL